MKAIYLAGADGCGKTTYISEIENHLQSKNIRTKHIWIRSPKIFSKPLMGYCRLVGLTRYKTIDGVKYVKRELYRSKFVSHLFPFLQLIDFKIKWGLKRRTIGVNEVVLFDRFSLDTLADLMVDTRRIDLHTSWIGKFFVKWIPPNTTTLIMDVEDETIRLRKKDTLFDEHLSEKLHVYQLLAKDLNLIVIDNNKEFEDVKEKVFHVIDL